MALSGGFGLGFTVKLNGNLAGHPRGLVGFQHKSPARQGSSLEAPTTAPCTAAAQPLLVGANVLLFWDKG